MFTCLFRRHVAELTFKTKGGSTHTSLIKNAHASVKGADPEGTESVVKSNDGSVHTKVVVTIYHPDMVDSKVAAIKNAWAEARLISD